MAYCLWLSDGDFPPDKVGGVTRVKRKEDRRNCVGDGDDAVDLRWDDEGKEEDDVLEDEDETGDVSDEHKHLKATLA